MKKFFFQRNLPEAYRKFFEAEFGKVLKGNLNGHGLGSDPKIAIEEIVEKFKKVDADHKDGEKQKEPIIIKDK